MAIHKWLMTTVEVVPPTPWTSGVAQAFGMRDDHQLFYVNAHIPAWAESLEYLDYSNNALAGLNQYLEND